MPQSEMNYAQWLLISPPRAFPLFIKALFFPTVPPFLEKMTGQNPFVQISARLNSLLCVISEAGVESLHLT